MLSIFAQGRFEEVFFKIKIEFFYGWFSHQHLIIQLTFEAATISSLKDLATRANNFSHLQMFFLLINNKISNTHNHTGVSELYFEFLWEETICWERIITWKS